MNQKRHGFDAMPFFCVLLMKKACRLAGFLRLTSCEDDAFCKIVGAGDGAYVIADDFGNEANWHHGAAVAVDVWRGIHLVDGAINGIVVVADGHRQDAVVKVGGDGAHGIVVFDAGTEQFTNGTVWHVGAAVADDGGGVNFHGAAININDVRADVEAHAFWTVFVSRKWNDNWRVVDIAAQLQGAVVRYKTTDGETSDAVFIGAHEHIGNGHIVGCGVDVDWYVCPNGEPIVAQQGQLYFGGGGAAGINGDRRGQGLVARTSD